MGKQITIYGDGKQVRDVLFIDDLIRAFELAYENKDCIAGKVFNIGGGPQNTLSLHALIRHSEKESGEQIPLAYDNRRPGDQKVYVYDISLPDKAFGWRPIVRPDQGVRELYNWVYENKHILQ